MKNATCDTCNHGFSKFEQPLIKELTPLRLMLLIPDRYGKVPHTEAVAITDEDEYQARVLSDGTVRLKPVVTEKPRKEGKREFWHRFLTDGQKEKLRESALREGKDFTETGPGAPKKAEIHIRGDLMEIGSEAGLRTAAKIAYVGLAYKTGVNVALADAFDRVREYVRHGTEKGVAHLFVLERFLNSCQQGPHQHSIVLAGRHDKRRVDAIVRLFGGLCYFVELSSKYDGADFCDTLIYDAYRREIGGMLWSNALAEFLQTEDVATSPETVWDDLEASGRRFCDFFNQVIAEKTARVRTGEPWAP